MLHVIVALFTFHKLSYKYWFWNVYIISVYISYLIHVSPKSTTWYSSRHKMCKYLFFFILWVSANLLYANFTWINAYTSLNAILHLLALFTHKSITIRPWQHIAYKQGNTDYFPRHTCIKRVISNKGLLLKFWWSLVGFSLSHVA